MLEQLRFDGFDRKQGDQADQGADSQAARLAARQTQDVIKELVLVLPQSEALATDVVHGARDVQEVLEKLVRDLFIRVVFARQLECDDQHVEGVHAHPRSTIGLL